MIELLVFASIALVVTWAGVVFLLLSHQAERREWGIERRALIDRIIANNTGEVIALDRTAQQRPPRDHEPRLVEGLN